MHDFKIALSSRRSCLHYTHRGSLERDGFYCHFTGADSGLLFTSESRDVRFPDVSGNFCNLLSMVRRAMACRSQYNSLQQFCWTALFFCVEEYDPIRYGTSTTPRMLAGHRRCIFNLHLCRRHLNRLFILLSRLHTAYSRASLR